MGRKNLKITRPYLRGILITVAYMLLAVSFRFLAGDALFWRDSRGNVSEPPVDTVVELTCDTVIEESFSVSMDRLQSVSIPWRTYYRENSGTITVALLDTRDDSVLVVEEIAAESLTDGTVTVLTLPQPPDDLRGARLRLRLTADSPTGFSAAACVSSTRRANENLTVNGLPANGSLCFSAVGQDRIGSAGHYWSFSAAFGLLLAAFCVICRTRRRKGKPDPISRAGYLIRRYSFLVRQLIKRDFKTKYKRSVLGVLWSLLGPLLSMSVQYMVFSRLFRFEVAHYPVYLLSGIVTFNYFSEACGMTMISIINNATLITKVYVPKYIFPMTRTVSSFINLILSMLPLMLVTILSGVLPTEAWLLIAYPLLCVCVFCIGVGMILAAAMVFFRDVQFLWTIVSMIWMYVTPIFYPVSILPKQVLWVVKLNPLFYYVDFLRTCIIDGVSPDLRAYLICAVTALASLLLGSLVFKKLQDKFVLYL